MPVKQPAPGDLDPIERASRELGATVVAHVPFSHQLTIGRVLAFNRWRTVAGRAWNLYRAGRMVINPANAVLGEVWTALRDRAFGSAQQELQGWLLREYVRETGRYAIELYSGRLRLDDTPVTPSAPDLATAGQRAQAPVEPLRILVLGQTNAGKSSLVKALLELDSHLAVSVSHTTRAPRGQEQDGREYWFIPETQFRDMADRGDFFEWAEVHGNLYGTSRAAIESRIAGGQDVVLEIDWQGALQIKKLFPHAVLIFILPPSWEELLQRLHRRGEDGPDVIAGRMANARVEVAQARHFDFVIINALFETALFDLKTVVHSQRLKYAAQRRNKSQVFAALNLI